MSLRLSQLRHTKSEPLEVSADAPKEELLVFGYQCKLFRDDEKATYIEEEGHLIPWMGDTNLMIDRYDGRGHLHDLGQYDADVNPINVEMLDEDEKRIEAMCDEERYMELHVDLSEKAIYEEEELKRLHQELAADETAAPYQAVGFSYEQYDPAEPTQDTGAAQRHREDEEEGTCEDEDEPGLFIPAPELQIPPHMECPKSMKLNAVIEKTAEFVSKHGGQMEIMIKTKQSNNPQFGFLVFEHPLNPYYKHMVAMIKCGRYIPGLHKPQMQMSESPSASDSDSGEDDGYLHPSLRPSSSTQNLPKLPALTSAQIESTSYGMLIKRIGIIVGAASPVATSQCSSSRQGSPREKELCRDDEGTVYDIPPPPGTEEVQLPVHLPKPASPVPPEAVEAPSSPTCDEIVVSVPPPDAKMIIDRMASYVLKDGVEFENQVRAQGDLRFEFLNASHLHNAYYERVKEKMASEEKGRTPVSKAVSFSIKFKDQDGGLLEKKANFLLNDSSDDECDHKRMPVTASAVPAPNAEQQAVVPPVPSPGVEESHKKLNEQRLKDKLAAAAREKLAQTTKESKHKLLQEERKKRAAMFVNMLKTTGKGELQDNPVGPDLPTFDKRSYKDGSTREGRGMAGGRRSRSRSPRHSQSRSSQSRPSHHRHRSKSRSPKRRHSRNNTTRFAQSSRRSRSPEVELRSKRKHSKKSKSRHRSRSPVELARTVKQEQRPAVDDRLARPSTVSEASSAYPKSQHKHAIMECIPSGKPPFIERANEPQDEMIVKVRKMLQASRKAIFKEDMIGD